MRHSVVVLDLHLLSHQPKVSRRRTLTNTDINTNTNQTDKPNPNPNPNLSTVLITGRKASHTRVLYQASNKTRDTAHQTASAKPSDLCGTCRVGVHGTMPSSPNS